MTFISFRALKPPSSFHCSAARERHGRGTTPGGAHTSAVCCTSACAGPDAKLGNGAMEVRDGSHRISDDFRR